MAYLNLKNYNIYKDTNIDNFLDDYIEVDDMMAPIIRILNMKGYKTIACCSGHPFKGIAEAFSDNIDELENIYSILSIEQNIGGLYRGVFEYYGTLYIAFDEEISINDITKQLPEGFEYDSKESGPPFCLRYHFDNDNGFFEFLDQQLYAIKKLYYWADSLDYRR